MIMNHIKQQRAKSRIRQRDAYVISKRQAPGDILCLTALVRDLAITRPDIDIYVNTNCKDLWKNNPYIKGIGKAPPHAKHLELHYGGYIPESGRSYIHFLKAWHKFFTLKTGIVVPLLYPWPDLHLSEEEKRHPFPGLPSRYVCIASGGKKDFMTKHWSYKRHQEVVDLLKLFGITCVQVGQNNTSGSPPDLHPPLRNVVNLLGKTDHRNIMRVIYHSDAVICTITYLMHLAAALQKPCVVTAGGREEWWWEGYVNPNPGFGHDLRSLVKVPHRYLHTISQLNCCERKGCWRSKVTKKQMSDEEEKKNRKPCALPIRMPDGQDIPECMRRIETRHVVESVLSYYLDGTIPMTNQMLDTGLFPAIGEKTFLTLPDGRRASLKLEIEPELPSRLIPVPVVEPPVAAATAPPAPSLSEDLVEEVVEKPVVEKPKVWTGSDNRVTICVLTYGDYPSMHRLCIDSIIQTTKGRASIRVGAAKVCEETKVYLSALLSSGKIDKVYWRDDNPGKYVVMRQMFFDKDLPLDDWVIWFDDDSICNKRSDWLRYSMNIVKANYQSNTHMFGIVQVYNLSPNQINAIKQCGWYRGRQIRNLKRVPVPNGNKAHFATGSWWIISRLAIETCDIPEPSLVHNGGDVIIGEQLWQGGFKLMAISKDKNLINWSSKTRRGKSEGHWRR